MKIKIDWFALFLSFAMFMVASLDISCVVFIFTHYEYLTPEIIQALFALMIGMFSFVWGAEATAGMFNNYSKRKFESSDTINKGVESNG